MSLLTVKITYGNTVADGAGNPSAPYSGFAFDTDTHTIVSISGSWRGAALETKPANYWMSDGGLIHFECAGFTATFWHYNRAGNTATETGPFDNHGYCGYVAPEPCNLTLTLTTTGNQVTAVPGAGSFIGPLRYSKDGGTLWQSATRFFDLPDGSVTIHAQDLGVTQPACVQSASIVVNNATAGGGGTGGGTPPVVPVYGPPATAAPVALHYALSASWLTFGNFAPGALVQLQLLMETGAHRSGEFELLFEGVKLCDAAGEISFRVDAQLRSRLRLDCPRDNGQQPYFDTQAVRNFYAITRLVNPTTGQPGPGVSRELRTALLAQLPSEDGFLTRQPASKKMAPGEPEFLYYLVPQTPPTTLRLTRTVTTTPVLLSNSAATPGTVRTQVNILVDDGAGPAGFRLLVVPVVGPALPTAAQRVLVQLGTSDGQVLTGARSYDFVARPAGGRARVFLFHSPAGGVDTLVATGNGTARLQVKTEIAERGPLRLDTRASAQRYVYQLDAARTFKVAAGWKTRAEMRWLQGFLLARWVWLLRQGTFLPILATKRDLTYETDTRGLEGLSFEFELASELADLEEL